MRCDVVIFGGGVAGLWILDELVHAGWQAVLLETRRLGQGQTIAAQGIIHGGLKYSLQGLLTRSAVQVREMPQIWRDCLRGRRRPNLSATHVRSDCCYLWRTDTAGSRLGMLGARIGLQVTPQSIARADRPPVLQDCPGTVARLDEQVIDTQSLLQTLADQHRDRILQINPVAIRIDSGEPGELRSVEVGHPWEDTRLVLQPRHCVLAAGSGNAHLRTLAGLSSGTMQRRPLQMTLVRGPLPELHGHCVDGAKTRVTITSAKLGDDEVVWQIGGQLAELGVKQSAAELIGNAADELQSVLPGLSLEDTQWATYRVDRAEARSDGGRRPDTAAVLTEGNVVTVWPTKLALAPQAAATVRTHLERRHQPASGQRVKIADDWPRPAVALPVWEERDWIELPGRRELRRAA